jgi:hypothetical protein
MREKIRTLFHGVMSSLPAAVKVRLHYVIHHNRIADIRHPTRFTEKIVRRKLFDRDKRFVDRADKVAVKTFVASKLGEQFVIPLLWSGSQLPPRDKRNWQIPFVIKPNNGSASNIFVRSESDRNWDLIDPKCSHWLSAQYADWAGEWLYSQIEPRLLVEPYVGELAKLPLDYKLFVFGGRVEYIEVDTDREIDHKRTFFDREWNRQEFSLGYKLDHREIMRPKNLIQMIEAAEILAEDFPFVRIDFYEINGQPKFGEMTFYPDAGNVKFVPDAYDIKLGQLWK